MTCIKVPRITVPRKPASTKRDSLSLKICLSSKVIENMNLWSSCNECLSVMSCMSKEQVTRGVSYGEKGAVSAIMLKEREAIVHSE